MKGLSLFAGCGLFVGGTLQMYASLAMRRRGTPCRGQALAATALALGGALTVTGVLPSATSLGVASVFIVAGAIWAGLVLHLRDARQSRSVR
jgi:hypothetical protein